MSNQRQVEIAVQMERARQDARWGEQNHPDGTGDLPGLPRSFFAMQAKKENAEAVAAGTLDWRGILSEEVAEAYAETDPNLLYDELIQVAAVAQCWAEAIVRRQKAGGSCAPSEPS